MKAVAVYPQRRKVELVERDEPRITTPRQVRIRMLEVGVCGTDKELCAFVFGAPPEGSDHFILGHESLGEVESVGAAVEDLRPGDLVVGRVRLPCGDAACPACELGHQDFCATGKYFEHGITRLDGFMAEYVVEDRAYLHAAPRELREVAVLIEPLTIAEKAYAEVVRVQERLPWRPSGRRAVVLGAGPVGLLGAMKLVAEGFDTWIYSLLFPPNASAGIAAAVGARYLSSQRVTPEQLREQMGTIDVVYEALGAAQIAFDVLKLLGPNGVYVFTGVPRAQSLERFETEKFIANLVLKNQAVIGIVNSGEQAFNDAIRDLGIFYARWPDGVRSLITGRFAMEDFREPVMGMAGGIKNVIRIAN
ncbi:MAG TPA: glucose 1-dehydrogenase [Bryobacteraceae bacterium]|jgi:threonine dehydrogenase-like Zn-dependent dehydrogenase